MKLLVICNNNFILVIKLIWNQYEKKEKIDTPYSIILIFLVNTISRFCISCNAYLNVKLSIIIEKKN